MLDRIVITDVIYVEEKQEGKRLQRSRRSSRCAREARKSRRRRRLRAPAFLPCQRVFAPGHPMLKRRTRRFSVPVLSLRPAISAGDLVNR